MAEPEMTSRPTNDAYTGMLAIALLALIAGSLLMFLDYNQYPDRAPKGLPTKPPPVEAPVAPKPEPTPEDKKPDETKKDETKKDETKEEMKKDDAKDMKKDEEKKDAEKKDAEKKDAEKKSASLLRPGSPLLEIGVGVAHEDLPVVRRRRVDAVADPVAEGTVDERPHRRPGRDRETG